MIFNIANCLDSIIRLRRRIFSYVDAWAENIESAGNTVAIRGRDREEISMPVEARNRRPK